MRKSYSFHSELGSALNRLIKLALVYYGYKLFGLSILGDLSMALIGLFSYWAVVAVYRGVRVWRY